jgi:hypothetical protein
VSHGPEEDPSVGAQDHDGHGSWAALLVALGALALCCAGPIVLAAVAAAGFGALVEGSRGALLVGAGALGAALAVGLVVWRRRRACAVEAGGASGRPVASGPASSPLGDTRPRVTPEGGGRP